MLNGTYSRRVALHEAGHFLVAYLLGLLPRAYTLSSLDLFLRWVYVHGMAGHSSCREGLRCQRRGLPAAGASAGLTPGGGRCCFYKAGP